MGLRTLEGVALEEIAPLAIPAERLAALADFVGVDSGRLVVTRPGRLVLDRVLAELADGA